MNQLTNLPSSLAEPEAAPSQRPLGPEKCSNVPPLAAHTTHDASLSHVDLLPFVTAQDAPALATVTGADVLSRGGTLGRAFLYLRPIATIR